MQSAQPQQMTMMKSTPLEDCLKNQPPLRSINDFSNDEDVEAALRDRIHCADAPKCPQPQHPSLMDCFSGRSIKESSARQAVARELSRLKSLKSLQVLDTETIISQPASVRRGSFTSGDMCFPNPGAEKRHTVKAYVNGNKTAAGPAANTEPSVDLNAATMSTLNRLVDMATRMFDVSTAAISVTDMERQKILASKGIGKDIQELPRQCALGAHIVSLQEDTLIVPDLTADDRFQHLELHNSRFYGSVPLVTPEGERIGAVCVLDSKPRPQGLNEDQLPLLRHLAELAMQALVERRTRLCLEKKLQSATRVVSATVHDLLTPLTAIELALSLLHEDQDFQGKLSQHQKESVKIASNCVGVLGQMCRRMRDQHSASCKQQVNGVNAAGSVPIAAPSSLLQLPNADSGLSADSFRIMYGSGTDDKGNARKIVRSSSCLFENKVLAAPQVTVAVQDLVKSVHMAVDAIPKTVPVAISLHAAVPSQIVTDDLKVLRCALNLLEHCASIATSGTILLSIKPQYCSCGRAMLGFHCENRSEEDSSETNNPAIVDQCIRDCCSATHTATSKDLLDMSASTASTPAMSCSTSSRRQDCCHRHGSFERQCLRNCAEVNLYSVAMQMDAMGGDCGLDDPAGDSCASCATGTTEGKSFWFRIPLVEPHCRKYDKEILRVAPRLAVTAGATPKKNKVPLTDPTLPNSVREEVQQPPQQKAKETQEPALVLEVQPRKRRALIIEDSIVIRKVIANALSKIGFETELAVNGMEGLHHLQCSIYDVVLCDFLMPVMDGLDCVKQYRDWEKTHRPFLRQYIIGMSAHASDQDVERGLKVGMDIYKPKPLTYKGLKNIVDACECNQRKNLISAAMDEDNKSSASTKTGKKSPTVPSFDGQQPKMCLIATKDNDFDLARLTEARGWKSLIVHDGEDALHALMKRNYDAVFIDEKLPLLSGRKAAEEFRRWEKENRVNSQTNVFILTASSSSAVPTGANGVLSKPVNLRAFEQLLERAEEPSLHIIVR